MTRITLTIAAMLASAAPAFAFELPAPNLVSSVPAADSEVPGPVSEVTVTFDADVDLVQLTLDTPGEQGVVIYDAMVEDLSKKGRTFTLPLPEARSVPGRYSINVSASVTDPADSSSSATSTYANFVIAGPPADASDPGGPAPELMLANPTNDSTVAAPVSEIMLAFNRGVHLGEIVLITPDQNRIKLHDPAGDSAAQTGQRFTLKFPEGVTLAGTYLVDVNVSSGVLGSAEVQTFSTFSSFVIP